MRKNGEKGRITVDENKRYSNRLPFGTLPIRYGKILLGISQLNCPKKSNTTIFAGSGKF